MIGREHHDKTVTAHRTHMANMTGVEIPGCPWRAFSVPLVREVLHALRFFESGNLAVALPNPSHRLMEGIGYWNQVYNRVQSKQMEMEREQRKAEAASAQAQQQMGARHGRR